jgi:arylsulfatase A-like enzyme
MMIRLIVALCCCAWTAQAKPNVLMISIDDLNDWIGCMEGHPNAKTPNMDRLAARGTLFLNAHCQAPICGPSRASLMSGLLPSTTGIYGQIQDQNIRKDNSVTESITFLPEYLGKNGYKTIGVGKLFHKHAPKGVFEVSGGREGSFGPKPKERFEWPTPAISKTIFQGKKYGTSTDWGVYPERDEEMIDHKAANWAIKQLKQEHDRPFFLAVGFVRPHVPWYAPQKWFDMHPKDQIKLPPYQKGDQADVPKISRQMHEMEQMPTAEWAQKSGQWPAICQAYLASTTFVDHCVGRVLDALEKSPHADNTIIMLWSDHGYHIGEKNRFAKHSVWEEATKVPLIVSTPGGKAQRCTKPVQLLDIYPTLLDLCGLPPNTTNEGNSLKPLIEKADAEWPHAAITTYCPNNHAIRTDTHRYIRYRDGSEELYDHRKDPNEWHNLASNPEYDAVKKKIGKHFPTTNAKWTKHSGYLTNDFFKKEMELKKAGKLLRSSRPSPLTL